MYSKQQASQPRQEFWTAFGKYMQPVLSAEGEKINWVNYKTGVKHIFFRMQANKGALIAIELSYPNPGDRRAQFNKFLQLKTLFTTTMQEDWIWQQDTQDENGKITSRISRELAGVNIFNKADWPALISFFKPRIIALDAFWSMVKPGFEI
jgi:hypothetical protein